MAVLCLGKFLFWPFWPFLGQKYIACDDIIWPFSSKPLMIFCYVLLFKLSLLFKTGQWKFLFWQKNRGHFRTLFGPPQRGWDLWFSLRPFVRPSVRQRSQNPFIGIFWFLAQSWAFLMQGKWHFRILPEKSRLAVFGPFWSKNGHFWPKINVLANFSKSVHRIFFILYI